ncbi:MAG: xanthine dehydrogenase family protein subunit M [Rhodospirillaceae bacterium]
MKPSPFSYEKPGSLSELFGCLTTHGDEATILAGGQSLVATLNMRLSSPGVVVDINGIDELKGISVDGDTLRIGALTRHVELEKSADVEKHAPLVHMAMPHIAHVAIRNRGTFGGSIAFADPAAELPACVLALNGRIELTSANGSRTVEAVDFFKDLYDTDLQPGEVVSAVELPVQKGRQRAAFDELARRHGDYAMAGLAAVANVDGGVVSSARFVFFGVGATPMLAANASAALTGAVTDGQIESAQKALENDLSPFDDINSSAAMKMHLAKELLGRVARQLIS